MNSKIRIGTRGSPLALYQAHEVRDRLMRTLQKSQDEFEIVVIKTTGDMVLDRALSEIGGKELFTKEIEQALLEERLDIAVHSSKDMPTELPDGLHIGCFLEREDVRDAFLSAKYISIDDLPQGATIGTASLRRAAQIKSIRPDLKTINFRGNVQTRLKKLQNGDVDATFLAFAGLRRLGMANEITSLIEVSQMLPAIGQGAICVECRANDDQVNQILSTINHQETEICLHCERAFLAALDGSCRTPIAGLAEIKDNQVQFEGQVLKEDGSHNEKIYGESDVDKATTLGKDLGIQLKQIVGDDYFRSVS